MRKLKSGDAVLLKIITLVSIKTRNRGAWLSEKHVTLDLEGHEFELHVGHRDYLSKQNLKETKN